MSIPSEDCPDKFKLCTCDTDSAVEELPILCLSVFPVPGKSTASDFGTISGSKAFHRFPEEAIGASFPFHTCPCTYEPPHKYSLPHESSSHRHSCTTAFFHGLVLVTPVPPQALVPEDAADAPPFCRATTP
ncbi:hypothetical protein AQUCO_03200103v1 [Aquilegia coerulea]|uniref:Uncharacterized protein n=1 Tax=Aquilegia coerulea TaxID=218851 RepID=A0A2G5D056_AQUCA|nr:hypothetical protein AQUCO_03200103v1 [Aquilegia coerulea]